MGLTINKLHKELTKLIKNGHGRKRVMINKNTFTHPLESDGCVILPIKDIGITTYIILDDDGGHKEKKDGSECLNTSCLLIGESQ